MAPNTTRTNTNLHQGADCTNPRACATTYACAVRQGLLFAWAAPVTPSSTAPDESCIPIVEEFEDPEWVTQVSNPGDATGVVRVCAGDDAGCVCGVAAAISERGGDTCNV